MSRKENVDTAEAFKPVRFDEFSRARQALTSSRFAKAMPRASQVPFHSNGMRITSSMTDV